MVSIQYCGTLHHDRIRDSILCIEPEIRFYLAAARKGNEQAIGHIPLRETDNASEGTVDVDIDLRVVEGLLDAQIGDAGHRADALQQIGGISIAGVPIRADDLHVDWRRQAEIEDLRDDVRRQERKGGARELLRQHGAQLFDIIRCRSMAFLQGYQHIGICGADRAAIAVGHVDAAVRQPDVIDDIVHLAGRDDLADGLLSKIAQTRRLLDPGSRRGADMHENLTRIDGGEKVLAEERRQSEGQEHAGEDPGNEGLGPAKSEQKQRTDHLRGTARSHPLRKPYLEPLVSLVERRDEGEGV